MGGGLMQLVAYGAQDIYLTGNPQITFFKVVYRRHTNFSIESIEQTFNGSAGFGKKINCPISRSGDLVNGMVLEVDLQFPIDLATAVATDWASSPFLGHRLIKCVDIEIGGHRIDRHYGEWMHIWSQLVLPESKKDGFEDMIGHKYGVVADITSQFNSTGEWHTTPKLYIPLQFWFCRNPGLALPLIGLQYHDTKITVEFNELNKCFNKYRTGSLFDGSTPVNLGGTSITNASLWVDYIYLDTDERRRFAQLTHEYLIEQVQFPGDETVTAGGFIQYKLPFNHPVKELVWVINSTAADASGQWWNYTDKQIGNPWTPGGAYSGTAVAVPLNNCEVAQIKLNSQDRIAARDGNYFNKVQPYNHHTRIPYTGINCYSFALKPEEHQPSGTCNFSRIDNSTLYFKSRSAGKIKVFAINYNILRIMSGMAGLAYSN